MSVRDLLDFWPLILGFIGLVSWCAVIQSDLRRLKEDHGDLKQAEADKDRALWLKIETLQTTLNQVLIAIGELKGRIKSDN